MSDKNALIQPDRGQAATPIHLVSKDTFAGWAKRLSAGQRAAVAGQTFEGGGYDHAIVPDGETWIVVAGVADPDNLSSWCLAKLGEVLIERDLLHEKIAALEAGRPLARGRRKP